MKKETFFRWLQKYSSLILRMCFPEIVAFVNRLIEQRAKEKVSDDKSVFLEETVSAKINRFWSETDTKCRAFWVLLAVCLILGVLMSILLNHAIISVFIASCAIVKTLFKLIAATKVTNEK